MFLDKKVNINIMKMGIKVFTFINCSDPDAI